jgi:hypothetical protein
MTADLQQQARLLLLLSFARKAPNYLYIRSNFDSRETSSQ